MLQHLLAEQVEKHKNNDKEQFQQFTINWKRASIRPACLHRLPLESGCPPCWSSLLHGCTCLSSRLPTTHQNLLNLGSDVEKKDKNCDKNHFPAIIWPFRWCEFESRPPAHPPRGLGRPPHLPQAHHRPSQQHLPLGIQVLQPDLMGIKVKEFPLSTSHSREHWQAGRILAGRDGRQWCWARWASTGRSLPGAGSLPRPPPSCSRTSPSQSTRWPAPAHVEWRVSTGDQFRRWSSTRTCCLLAWEASATSRVPPSHKELSTWRRCKFHWEESSRQHLDEEAAEGFHARLCLLDQQEAIRRHNVLLTWLSSLFSVKMRPILVQETCDMHSYTCHSVPAITNWIASTDGVKNCQEKESWVVDTFHEVGQEGHTLKLQNARFYIFKEAGSWGFSTLPVKLGLLEQVVPLDGGGYEGGHVGGGGCKVKHGGGIQVGDNQHLGRSRFSDNQDGERPATLSTARASTSFNLTAWLLCKDWDPFSSVYINHPFVTENNSCQWKFFLYF